MTKLKVLNRNGDFHRLYNRGKSAVHPALVTYVMKNRVGYCRYGITAGKKIGNAVARNRVKRIIREAYRFVSPGISGSYDIVFVARTKTLSKKSTDIQKVMSVQLAKLGVI